MRLGHTELFVRDPLTSKSFYVDVLGFELVAVQNEKYVWLRLGDREILLRPGTGPAEAPDYQRSAAAIVLYTVDVQGTAQRLRSRGLRFEGIDGRDNCLTFRDPDGHWFQLADPDHP